MDAPCSSTTTMRNKVGAAHVEAPGVGAEGAAHDEALEVGAEGAAHDPTLYFVQ